MLLACNLEERFPSCVNDFLYICDDAYKRSQLITMEANILQVLNFDITIPVAYRFLRRYSKCVNAALVTKDLGGWNPCLQFHSGYSAEDLAPLARKLQYMLSSTPDSKLATVWSKYSHKVFFEVTLMPPVNLEKLEKFLK
ncbi:hypothetical protein AOLI_G00217910 [Acnodon oligacanthus]